MPVDEELDLERDLPELPITPVTEQFPALGGDVQAEIDHRSPEPAALGQFTKTVQVARIGIPPDHPMHRANAVAVVTDAIQRGLHPHGDVHLVDAVEHDAPRSQYTDFTYAVDVVPASIDTDSAGVLTPSAIASAGA